MSAETPDHIDIAELRRLCEAATKTHLSAIGGYLTTRDPRSGSFSRSIYDLNEIGQETSSAPFQAIPFAKAADADKAAACWNALPALLDRIEALEAENTVLRGLVQSNPDWRCPYGQPVSHIAKCPSGFPGCACADDRMTIMMTIMMSDGEAKG